MMEILFKAKRVVDKQWIEGTPFQTIDNKWFIRHKLDNDFFDIEVIPETICLFIGRTDKNNKKIFIGDSGIHEKYGKVYVQYLIQECAFVYVSEKSDHRMGHRNDNTMYYIDNNFEITGNIRDNDN